MSFSATNAFFAKGTTVENIFSDNFSANLLPKDHNSIKHIAANVEFFDVIESLGEWLFPKDYESKWGLKLLTRLGNAEISDQEFEQSNLKDQMQIVSSICHSKLLNASDRGGNLNDSEISAIIKAFDNLETAFAKIEKPTESELSILSGIKDLKESLPSFLELSKTYVDHIKSFQCWIPHLLEKYEVSEELSKAITSLSTLLFNGNPSYTKNPTQPDLKNRKFDMCFPDVNNFISSIVKGAANEKRELSYDELSSISEVLKSLSDKMNFFTKANKIKFFKAQLDSKKEYISSLLEHVKKSVVDKETELKQLQADLLEYTNSTKSCSQFKDMSFSIEIGKKNREKNIEKVNEDLRVLKEDMARREKSLLKINGQISTFTTKTIEFAKANFYSERYMETDVLVQDDTVQNLILLSQNPKVVANFVLEYLSFLEEESARKPKSWFAGIWGW